MADMSLCINKYVQQILEESEEIKAIIGNNEHKIFPLLQPEEVTFPFIVHSRTGIQTTYTKDIEYTGAGWYNIVQFSIICVSNDYMQSVELANAVRHSVETYRWKDKDIYIHPIELTSASEYTTEYDGYVQQLNFQCMVE